MICRLKELLFLALVSSASANATAPTTGVDVLRSISQDGKGLELSHQAVSTVRKNNQDLKLSAKALATYEYVSEVVGGVDLSDVFESKIPVKINNIERMFSLSATRRDAEFVVDNPRTAMSSVPIAHPFDFATEFRIKKNRNPIPQEKLGYGIRPAFQINLGPLDHHSFMRFAAGLLRMISPENLAANNAKANPKSFIFREFSQTLPETFALVQRYIELSPDITVSSTESSSISKVDGEVTLKVATIKKDFPELGEYLEKLMTLEIDLDLSIRSATGTNLAQFTASTGTRTIGFTYFVAAGKIIPSDENGQPQLDQGIAPDSIRDLKTSIHTNVQANVFGLKFRGKGIRVDTHFRDAVVAEATAKLVKLPVPAIEGRFLGLLPDWAIDMSIPGTMEGYLHTFTQGLLHANKGEGTVVKTQFDTSDPKHTKLKSEVGTEIVDNFFLGLGLKVVAAYLWPSPEVIHEGRMLITKHLVSLDQDLGKLVANQQRTLGASGIAH